MKKLLNTLYITSVDTYLALENENVLVKQNDKTINSFPLYNLKGIISFGFKGASPALMRECTTRDIDLCFLSQNGRFLGRVVGESRGNVLLRREQYRIADNEQRSGNIAKNFITGKLFNAKWVLQRALRDHGLRINTQALESVCKLLTRNIEKVRNAKDIETIRSYEGNSAKLYFSVFDELILQNKNDFYFHGRNRRPPTDNVNAMLSFCYTLLAAECSGACEAVGLDSYVGFMHTDRPGRASLALDIMEELRPVMADRFVLTMINNRKVSGNSFKKRENGAVSMSDDAKKEILKEWQNRKKEMIVHPYLKEKIEWGLVPYVQALLLARFIRGDIDQYPPFLWK